MATATVPTPEVRGAKVTFTVSAIIEGLAFGIFPLLFPATVYQWFSTVEPIPMELNWLRMVGMIALALGIGCWYARGGDRPLVRLMSGVMTIAKAGATVLFVIWLLNGTMGAINWVNAGLAAILALMNGWLFWSTQKE